MSFALAGRLSQRVTPQGAALGFVLSPLQGVLQGPTLLPI